jgi:hypothetical protein
MGKEHMRRTCEYGQCFPVALSPFYYNHSEVYDFFFLQKEEALKMGY